MCDKFLFGLLVKSVQKLIAAHRTENFSANSAFFIWRTKLFDAKAKQDMAL